MGLFPADPAGLRVELNLGGTWTNITPYALGRDDVVIRRGRPNEAGLVDPGSCTLSVNNVSGRFSPRNPTGPYYGVLGRNTPLRVRVRPGGVALVVPGGSGDNVSAPDTAALSVTGDLDLRIDLALHEWHGEAGLIAKTDTTTVQESWMFSLDSSGTLHLIWSTDGTVGGRVGAVSTTAIPRPLTGRKALRVTLDVNNGAGGWTATFYTSDTINGTWTQLGDPVTRTGTTSIFNSTARLYVGEQPEGIPLGRGEIYAARVLSGIAGTVVANPDFTVQPADVTSFTDAAGNTWTVAGNAEITDWRTRFVGEVASWPQKWTAGGQDVWVPIEAAGVLRRLGRSGSALRSPHYRLVTGSNNLAVVAGLTVPAPPPVAYWPCEDDAGATSIASGIGGPAMSVTGTPSFAQSTVLISSAPLPLVGNSRWTGPVPDYTPTGTIQVRFMLAVPAGGTTNGAVLMRLSCTGNAPQWDVTYSTGSGGQLNIKAYDAAGVNILSVGPVDFDIDGFGKLVLLTVVENGANVDWNLAARTQAANSTSATGGTLAGRTIGRATTVRIDPASNMDDVAVGHVVVWTQDVATGVTTTSAYVGETAGTRISRLCQEEGVGYHRVHPGIASTPMGAQGIGSLLGLLREAERTDQGILHESRDTVALAFLPRASLYNQDPTLALAYSARGLADLQPVEDDDLTVNDLDVRRTGGSSARIQLETGRLSIQDPPNGVGRYDDQVDVNTESDAELPDHASWRLHVSTVDEARYPVVALDLTTLTARAAAMTLDIGDRVLISDPPAWLPPDDISLLVQGLNEVLNHATWTIIINGFPETPWQVAVYDSDTSRYSSDGSTLAGGVNATATTLSVATPSGPLWTHADGDYDIRIAGERLTVINVTGSTSPQTFTVVRSLNGVVKALPADATVELWRPAIYTL